MGIYSHLIFFKRISALTIVNYIKLKKLLD